MSAPSLRAASSALASFVLVLLLATAADAAGPAWTNGQAAGIVLGQTDMTTSIPGTGPAKLFWPLGAAVDPTTGKLFVVEYSNHRVLRFPSAVALASGAAAEAVLGQANFTDNQANRGGTVGRDTLRYPVRLSIDSTGRLWVVDAGNQRILWFDRASSRSNGADADGVLGQSDFAQNEPNRGNGTTANSLYDPESACVDASGRLWVADSNNSRVLRFDNAAGLANGAEASGVLGQANFTFGSANRGGGLVAGANTLNGAWGVATDAAGRLWVADSSNNRILRYDNAASKPNGANADGVLGQVDFTHRAGGSTQSTVSFPATATLDVDGRLYVSDLNNHRVLIFNQAAAKGNGTNADNVLGQADFASHTPGTTAAKLNAPEGVFFDLRSNVLWVADRDNNRVLRFADPTYYLDLPLVVR